MSAVPFGRRTIPFKDKAFKETETKAMKTKAKLKWRVINSHFFPLIPRHMDPSNGRNNTRCGLFMAYAALLKKPSAGDDPTHHHNCGWTNWIAGV